MGHEALQEGLPGGLPEVERDRLLAPSLDRPEERVAVLEGTDRAEEVALSGQLDLDHFRAEVGEERRREGRGDSRAKVEHADASERAGHGAQYRAHIGADAIPSGRRAVKSSGAPT